MQAQTDFYEIYDYYSRPLLERTSFRIMLIVFTIGVGLLILFLFLKQKKKRISIWDWALKELAILSPEKCGSKGEYKIFYFKLTQILKKYLDKRFSWKTENKTDEELIGYLQSQRFDSDLTSQVEKTLHGASWVKFANEDALKSQAESDFKTVISVIQSTKPSENK